MADKYQAGIRKVVDGKPVPNPKTPYKPGVRKVVKNK